MKSATATAAIAELTLALILVAVVHRHPFGRSFGVGTQSAVTDNQSKLSKICAGVASDPITHDIDADSIPDGCEKVLAETFAPIIYHSKLEPNYPANVDWFLKHTHLKFHDSSCAPPPNETINSPSQNDLISQRFDRSCNTVEPFISNGTRSKDKMRTFFLEDVPKDLRRGSDDSREWYTYFHAYPNTTGGVTLQYWRFYAFNTGKTIEQGASDYLPGIWENLGNSPAGKTVKSMLAKVQVGYHGGDWEGIHVVLDGSGEPAVVRLMGHTKIGQVSWKSVPESAKEGNHLKIAAEPGGHASSLYDGKDPEKYIIQQTWTGGLVRREGGPPTPSGLLLNVGEREHPLNGQVFIQYSGLWGSPSEVDTILAIPPGTPNVIANLLREIRIQVYYASSGYWGPAFNETEMENNGFIKAWCDGRDTLLCGECYSAKCP